MSKFDPLTEVEIAAAIAATPEEDRATEDASQAVLPVPADAPPPPDRHPKLGKPVATWEYRDAEGNLMFVVCRFNMQAFEIVGATRDSNGGMWGKLIRWRDKDRKVKTMIVTDAETHGDPAMLCQKLRNVGLYIKRNHQRYLAVYLSDVLTSSRVRLVERTGWHSIGGRDVFVLPDRSIGPDGGETVVFNATSGAGYETKGTLDGWKNGVGRLAAEQRMVVLAISTALAGSLLHLAGQTVAAFISSARRARANRRCNAPPPPSGAAAQRMASSNSGGQPQMDLKEPPPTRPIRPWFLMSLARSTRASSRRRSMRSRTVPASSVPGVTDTRAKCGLGASWSLVPAN